MKGVEKEPCLLLLLLQAYAQQGFRIINNIVIYILSSLIHFRYFFELDKCENAVVEGQTYINCNKNNTETPVRLSLLAPDLTMSDFFGRRIEFCGIHRYINYFGLCA